MNENNISPTTLSKKQTFYLLCRETLRSASVLSLCFISPLLSSSSLSSSPSSPSPSSSPLLLLVRDVVLPLVLSSSSVYVRFSALVGLGLVAGGVRGGDREEAEVVRLVVGSLEKMSFCGLFLIIRVFFF